MARTDLRDRRQRAGDWLRSAREQAGLTTAALAEAMGGVRQQSISAYEAGTYSFPEDRIGDLARVLRMRVIDVRRGMGLWVPTGEPRVVSPEEAIRADPTLRPDQRETALGMLALIRGQAQPPTQPPAHAPADAHDPDAPPRRPGH